jgi:hypothetical protein
MTVFSVGLTWQRDKRGYRLLAAEPDRPESRKTILGWSGRPARICRQGGDLVAYEPMSKFPDLYLTFARSVTSPETLLGFVEKYGPLTAEGLQVERGDYVDEVLGQARAMRQLLETTTRGWARVKAETDEVLGYLPRPEVALVIDPATRTPRLQFIAPSLLAALWLQLGQALGSGAAVRTCQHCGTLFESGPGTGRRLDAKYCSPEHQIAFNSLRRSQ